MASGLLFHTLREGFELPVSSACCGDIPLSLCACAASTGFFVATAARAGRGWAAVMALDAGGGANVEGDGEGSFFTVVLARDGALPCAYCLRAAARFAWRYTFFPSDRNVGCYVLPGCCCVNFSLNGRRARGAPAKAGKQRAKSCLRWCAAPPWRATWLPACGRRSGGHIPATSPPRLGATALVSGAIIGCGLRRKAGAAVSRVDKRARARRAPQNALSGLLRSQCRARARAEAASRNVASRQAASITYSQATGSSGFNISPLLSLSAGTELNNFAMNERRVYHGSIGMQ